MESALRKSDCKIQTIVQHLHDTEVSRRQIELRLPNYQNAFLIGLHACGDLTNAILSWFCKSNFKSMAVMTCCYHKMKSFPVSDELKRSITDPLKSHFALRLGCQERFSNWLHQTEEEHKNHYETFGRRAILEKVCEDLNVRLKKKNRHGIRRPFLLSKEEYIEHVMKNYEFIGDCSQERIKERLSSEEFANLEWLEILTGLQAYLQILLEYLIVIDKLQYLKEHNKNASLIQMFDESISPRCILLWSQN